MTALIIVCFVAALLIAARMLRGPSRRSPVLPDEGSIDGGRLREFEPH